MELINNNPYRIAGILSSATAKELQKQKGKVIAFSKVGKQIISEFDFDILGEIERSEETIEKAFSNIQQNKDKVSNALFWFLGASPFDETAISYLKNGFDEKALEIWQKITDNKEVNSKNFSAFNNIGTLKLLSDSKYKIREGIESKIKLIDSDYFENFVHVVADETFTLNNKNESERLIDRLLTEFSFQYSSEEALNLFSNCNGSIHKYLSKKLTETPIHNIESLIEATKRKRQANKSDAYEIGLELFKNAKDDLTLLSSLFTKDDLKYKLIADNLAKEIMQCGIDYFHEWKETKDIGEEGLKLLKYAKSIAVGTQTNDRITSNIEGLQEWLDTSEERNEIERLNKFCWYCDNNEADKKFIYQTEMFKETSRSSIFEKRKVTFKKCKISINRCESCYIIHEKGDVSMKVFLPIYILCLIIFIIKVAIPEGWIVMLPFLFLGWIPAAIINWIVSTIINLKNAHDNKIKTESDINYHPVIEEMIEENWSFDEPSA